VGRRDGEYELPRWPGGCGSLELEGEAERKRKIKIKQGFSTRERGGARFVVALRVWGVLSL